MRLTSIEKQQKMYHMEQVLYNEKNILNQLSLLKKRRYKSTSLNVPASSLLTHEHYLPKA